MSTQASKLKPNNNSESQSLHPQDQATVFGVGCLIMAIFFFGGACTMIHCEPRTCVVASYNVSPCGIQDGPCFSVYPFVNISRVSDGRFVGPFSAEESFTRQFKSMNYVKDFQSAYPVGHSYECAACASNWRSLDSLTANAIVIRDDAKRYPSPILFEIMALLALVGAIVCAWVSFGYYHFQSRIPLVFQMATRRAVVSEEKVPTASLSHVKTEDESDKTNTAASKTHSD
jgi:hypothetical protein